MPTMPAPESTRFDDASSNKGQEAAPYSDAKEYLLDSLERISHLVKAYIIRRQSDPLSSKQTFDKITLQRIAWNQPPTASESLTIWQGQIQAAQQLDRHITARLKATPSPLRGRFPLSRILSLLGNDTKGDERLQVCYLQRDLLLITLLDHYYSEYRNCFNHLVLEDGSAPQGLTLSMAFEISQTIQSLRKSPLDILPTELALFRHLMVKLEENTQDLSRRYLRIDPAIARYLHYSGDSTDPELRGCVVPTETIASLEILPCDHATKCTLTTLATQLPKRGVVYFHGPAGSPFVLATQAVLSHTNISGLLIADVAKGAKLPDWESWVRRVYRHAALSGSAILWNHATEILAAANQDARWQNLLYTRAETPVFVAGEVAWDPDSQSISPPLESFTRIEFAVPSREIRRNFWLLELSKEQSLPSFQQPDLTLDLLASFHFTSGQIAEAIVLARGLELADSTPSADRAQYLYDGCRRVAARNTVSFTHKIPPRSFPTGEDPLERVILAPEGKQQLRELSDRIDHLNRVYYEFGFGNNLGLGRGLIALFSGPSGTGKTFAASLLASSRQRDLFKVDMSAVVSKYVGETEKNLARVFNDAQSSNAMLFFDEADALFGKRGEIDKAQDRWANMEVNYLLQRVEEFSGVVILATNFKQNVDDAFLRRVHVMIDFKLPNALDRQKILTSMFPHDVVPPNAEELTRFCEQFELSGGNLKNVAVEAAFRAIKELPPGAADKPLRIRLEHLVLAAAREYRKLTRPVTASSFGRTFYEMVKRELKLE